MVYFLARYVFPETTFTVDTPYEEYASHLRDQSSFRVSCLASIPDTEYEYFNEDDFRMKKPDIDIKVRLF